MRSKNARTRLIPALILILATCWTGCAGPVRTVGPEGLRAVLPEFPLAGPQVRAELAELDRRGLIPLTRIWLTRLERFRRRLEAIVPTELQSRLTRILLDSELGTDAVYRPRSGGSLSIRVDFRAIASLAGPELSGEFAEIGVAAEDVAQPGPGDRIELGGRTWVHAERLSGGETARLEGGLWVLTCRGETRPTGRPF